MHHSFHTMIPPPTANDTYHPVDCQETSAFGKLYTTSRTRCHHHDTCWLWKEALEDVECQEGSNLQLVVCTESIQHFLDTRYMWSSTSDRLNMNIHCCNTAGSIRRFKLSIPFKGLLFRCCTSTCWRCLWWWWWWWWWIVIITSRWCAIGGDGWYCFYTWWCSWWSPYTMNLLVSSCPYTCHVHEKVPLREEGRSVARSPRSDTSLEDPAYSHWV